ncbi:MAG: zinc-ribbon domain-containing protein [Desulfobulbaceae bacterium]|nr:zinc-ribbon domain-containing protein [Desulfobulbaceae bacterium]
MQIVCPNCQAKGKIGDEFLGKRIKCPKCQEPFVVAEATAGSQTAEPTTAQQAPSSPDTKSTVKKVCSECNIPTPESELLDFDGSLVCARCKNIYLQRVKEGVGDGLFEYVGFWMRVLAKVIDGFITGFAGYIIGIGIGFLLVSIGATDQVVVLIVSQLILMVIVIAYYTVFVGKYGATPGKMALGLKIVKPDGMQLTYLQAFGRYWGEFLSSIILCIGYLMVAFDDEKRGLHDRICGTRVVRSR